MSFTDICCHFRMDLSWDYDTIWRSGSDLSLCRRNQKGMREYIRCRGENRDFIFQKSLVNINYVNAFQTASYKTLSLILQMGIHNHRFILTASCRLGDIERQRRRIKRVKKEVKEREGRGKGKWCCVQLKSSCPKYQFNSQQAPQL